MFLPFKLTPYLHGSCLRDFQPNDLPNNMNPNCLAFLSVDVHLRNCNLRSPNSVYIYNDYLSIHTHMPLLVTVYTFHGFMFSYCNIDNLTQSYSLYTSHILKLFFLALKVLLTFVSVQILPFPSCLRFAYYYPTERHPSANLSLFGAIPVNQCRNLSLVQVLLLIK